MTAKLPSVFDRRAGKLMVMTCFAGMIPNVMDNDLMFLATHWCYYKFPSSAAKIAASQNCKLFKTNWLLS